MSTPPSRVAAFFDLDKTIIATSSAAAFSRPFFAGGLLGRADVLRSAYAHLLFMAGGADEGQSERMRAHLSSLVKGWDVDTVRRIVDQTLHEYIDPVVYREATALIADHHDQGHDVVIVSASGAELVEPIAAALGADHTIASRMEIVEGRYTGRIDFYAFGANKAVAIRELAADRGYDLSASYSYSDSITDAPMLDAVGHAYAVNPDRAMRRLAAERGWDRLAFRHPTPLKRAPRPGPVLAAVAAAVIGAVAIRYAVKARRARR